MGMFDEIRCEIALPLGQIKLLADHRSHWFQTKSLESVMDIYEIRADGTLWREEYSVVDKSDPSAEGLMALVGIATRTQKHWVMCSEFVGEIRFYTQVSTIGMKPSEVLEGSGWIEFSAYFVSGRLVQFHLVHYREPK